MHSLAPLLNQTWFIALMGITLIGAVLSAVHHAEVIAQKLVSLTERLYSQLASRLSRYHSSL